MAPAGAGSANPSAPVRPLGGVQALRALAASAVVLAHIGAPNGVEHKYFAQGAVLSGLYNCGITGVDLFFVISGLVMALTTARTDRGPQAAGRFLWRRITRIYPPYLVVTAVVFAVFLVRPGMMNSAGSTRPDVLASFLILPQKGFPLLPVGWTLVYEMFFYLVFAVVLLMPKRFMLPALGVWAAATLVLVPMHVQDVTFHVVHSSLVFEFIAGVLIGLFAHRLPRAVGFVALCVGMVGSGVVYAAEWGHPGLLLGRTSLRASTIGAALALVVLGVVVLERHGLLRAPRWTVAVGSASYSIYLTHLVTFGALGFLVSRIPLHDPVTHVAVVVGAFLTAVGVGLLFFRGVERPLLRAMSRRRPTPVPAVPLGVLVR